MKLSEIKGEAALDVVANIMEPFAEIFSDEAVKEAYETGTVATVAKTAIKNHKQAVIEVLAGLNMEEPDEYKAKMNIFTLPIAFLEVLNDEGLRSLFPSQGQETENASFGSATENTEVEEN